jgi:hypothetical protein
MNRNALNKIRAAPFRYTAFNLQWHRCCHYTGMRRAGTLELCKQTLIHRRERGYCFQSRRFAILQLDVCGRNESDGAFYVDFLVGVGMDNMRDIGHRTAAADDALSIGRSPVKEAIARSYLIKRFQQHPPSNAQANVAFFDNSLLKWRHTAEFFGDFAMRNLYERLTR